MNPLKTIALTVLISTPVFAEKAPDHMYPESIGDNLVKHTFVLPTLEDESEAKVEVRASILTNVDCNTRNLGNFIVGTVEGWGYSYLSLENLNVSSTMMHCHESERSNTQERVWTPKGELHRYNSKLPLVVYAPDGADVDFRVWKPEA
ncbi:hypothetical protein VCHA53O466_50495 [Vibrio chagasii]|nr:hypothetical protein VCHA53O466_50495 [Vibrio chagasii]